MTTSNDDGGTDGQSQDQDGQGGQQQQQTEDLFESAAVVLDRLDYPSERVQEVRDSYRLQDAFSARRLKLIGDEDPELAAKLTTAIEEEKASEAADEARAKEQERLDALQADEHTEEMTRLQGEAATAAHEAEMEQFFADGGLNKAWALADAVSGKETSFAEALTAWDQADALTREVASSRFGVGVIDFDPNPPNPEESS